MTYSPRSITINESVPASVAGYNVEVRYADGPEAGTVLVAYNGVAPNPSGDTEVPVGFNLSLVGRKITFWIQEIGPSGVITPWQQATGTYTITQLPDGAESITVNL